MKGIFNSVDNVREPPLPSNNGSKDDLPGEEEEIAPEDGGGRAPRRLSAAAQAETISHEPRA